MIQLVIFDWAGTTVDYGCIAPIQAMMDGFHSLGITVEPGLVRLDMGMKKRDHIARIADRLDCGLDEQSVEQVYQVFESALLNSMERYCDVKAHVPEAVEALRQKGIRIGSTTGYTSNMMRVLAPAAERNGYRADFWVASDQVPAGRPAPFMIEENMTHFGIENAGDVVKVGDTIVDIYEGKNARCWSLGVLKGSSLVGLSAQEEKSIPPDALAGRMESASKAFIEAGADYVLLDMHQLPAVIDKINQRK